MINQAALELGMERSCIRQLFEYGLSRAKIVGAENVYDFSLGNPSLPAPAEVKEALLALFGGGKQPFSARLYHRRRSA